MTPEELYQAKKDYTKAKRKDKPTGEASLNITSLMDIVSIIVVYLLKSYASDPMMITPIAEQKIPISGMDVKIKAGIAIYVSSRELIFNEEQVATLKDGELDPTSVQGHVIQELYVALEEERDKSREVSESMGEEWVGRIILIGDEALKFSTIVDIMYTAGRLEFSEYSFCVITTTS
jgi:biopolymer transport protein ExbD